MEESKIIISKFEYDDFVKTKLKYQQLIRNILLDEYTYLTYDKKDIVVNNLRVPKIIKSIDPYAYKMAVRAHLDRERKNNNDTN